MTNFSYPTSITNMVDFIAYGNVVTNDLYGGVLLLIIWFVMFGATKHFQSEKAFTVASFFTTISAILLSTIGIVPVGLVIIPLIMTAFSLFML